MIEAEGGVMVPQAEEHLEPPKLEEERMDPPLKPSEEVCSCPYLDFGLLASGIMEEKLPVTLSHLVRGNLL